MNVKQKCQVKTCDQNATELLIITFERDCIVLTIKAILCWSCSENVKHFDYVDMKRSKLKDIMNFNCAVIDVHTDKNRLTSLNKMGLNRKIQGEIQLDKTKEILRLVINPN